MFLRLAERSTARPLRAIAGMALLTIAAAPGLLRLELRTDGHALVPPDDPAVLFDREVREHFGLRDPIVVHLETDHPDGIYNAATLARVQALTAAFQAMPDVEPESVVSLATEHRDRVWTGTLDFRTFLEPLPETPQDLAVVRGDVEAAGILTGTLVSADRASTAILAGVASVDLGGPADRTALYRRILAAVEPHRAEGERITVVGAPVAESLLGTHILEDLARLLPLALLVIALVIGLGCRRLWGVVLGLTEVGACLTVTFGLMGWTGVPVYLTTAILPVILTTVGLADEIHVLWHYQRVLERTAAGAPAAEAVRATLRAMTRPVVVTSLTTTLGFLSFLASPIAPVRGFGAFAAFGILFCMVFTLTVVPAALTLLGPERMRRSTPVSRTEGRWRRLAAVLERRPGAVLVTAGLLTAALGLGVTRLEVQDSWTDGFAPGSPFRQATERANQAFFGTHLLHVHLTFERLPEDLDLRRILPKYHGPLLDPRLVSLAGELEDYLRSWPGVGGVLGPRSHLEAVQYLWLARRQDARQLTDEPGRLHEVIRAFERGRGVHRRREVIDDERRRAIVTIFLKDANFRDTAALMAAVRGWEREHLAAHAVRVDFAGDVAVSQAMIPAIVTTQLRSLLLAFLGALLAVFLLERSLKRALLAVAPAACAALWVFGLMGWLGIPLGVATSMFCAITLGIGVDYSIHFGERYRQARDGGHPQPLSAALEEAGPAIVADCLAIALGFGILAFSQVPANGRLGLLVALALSAGAALTLTGLGAGLRLLERRRRAGPG